MMRPHQQHMPLSIPQPENCQFPSFGGFSDAPQLDQLRISFPEQQGFPHHILIGIGNQGIHNALVHILSSFCLIYVRRETDIPFSHISCKKKLKMI